MRKLKFKERVLYVKKLWKIFTSCHRLIPFSFKALIDRKWVCR